MCSAAAIKYYDYVIHFITARGRHCCDFKNWNVRDWVEIGGNQLVFMINVYRSSLQENYKPNSS
jgi:hypothetical protein